MGQDRDIAAFALRHARGRYSADRAAQLSGVPKSTIYDWARNGVYAPDWHARQPMAWSYRDLIYLRLLAWLRQLGMPRPTAAGQVDDLKRLAESSPIDSIAADRDTLYIAGHSVNGNMLPFDDIADLLQPFDIHEPIHEFGRSRLWAPHLVRPSEYTSIAPAVLAGDPCVRGTRIASSSLHALAEERGLDAARICDLYPDLSTQAVEDAVELERQLRREHPAPLAA